MPDLIKSKTFGVSLDQIDPFCLHWSCSPSTVNGGGGGVTNQGRATLLQAKWIKTDLSLPDFKINLSC